jgi:hypothetical protein
MIINTNFFSNYDEEPLTEVEKLTYKLYEKDNIHQEVIYSFSGFIESDLYEEYHQKAIKILRVKKLKKIKKNEQKN